MEGHNKKKKTKKEFLDDIIKAHEKDLKEARARYLTQGHEISNQMLLDMINNGSSLDELKGFLERNLSQEGKNAMKEAMKGRE